MQEMIADHLVPTGGEAEQIGSLVYISELIKKRKKQYYPTLKSVVTNYDLNVSNRKVTLNVSFAPIGHKKENGSPNQ